MKKKPKKLKDIPLRDILIWMMGAEKMACSSTAKVLAWEIEHRFNELQERIAKLEENYGKLIDELFPIR